VTRELRDTSPEFWPLAPPRHAKITMPSAGPRVQKVRKCKVRLRAGLMNYPSETMTDMVTGN
jgi:hypothetical protein